MGAAGVGTGQDHDALTAARFELTIDGHSLAVFSELSGISSSVDVVDYMSANMGPGLISVHVANHPEITVAGETASGTWAFEDTVIATDFGMLIRGAGYYNDTYRRDADGAWRIASTAYERIYEAMTSLADTPSFKLIANRFDPELAH